PPRPAGAAGSRAGSRAARAGTLWPMTPERTAARRRAAERQRFLAEASVLLDSSLDYDTTLQRVAQLAVPRFADLCVVDQLEADGTLRRVAVASATTPPGRALHEIREPD